MSYDVSITHGTLEKDLGNYTYNCSGMFAAGAGGNTLCSLNGMKCSDAAPVIRKAVEWMRTNPEECIKQNPGNGWGSFATFLPWVESILTACEENPDATLQVY